MYSHPPIISDTRKIWSPKPNRFNSKPELNQRFDWCVFIGLVRLVPFFLLPTTMGHKLANTPKSGPHRTPGLHTRQLRDTMDPQKVS